MNVTIWFLRNRTQKPKKHYYVISDQCQFQISHVY